MTTRLKQRWRAAGSHSWRHVNEGGFDQNRYGVAELEERTAADFVRQHHYAATWPSTRFRFGMYDLRTAEGPCLVGVIALGVPMSNNVLTKPFPGLEPNVESVELQRVVLLDGVLANGESWFGAEVFRLVADCDVRGVVTFADPVSRWRRTATGAELIKPGHWRCIYQALNFMYLGRATPRNLVILPDAGVLSARAIAKVTGRERGCAGVINRLVALGASAPNPDEDTAQWLRSSLHRIGAVRQAHPGNHRYALRIGRNRGERSRVVIGLAARRYPKPEPELPLELLDSSDIEGAAP
jgi:hypothetical protein